MSDNRQKGRVKKEGKEGKEKEWSMKKELEQRTMSQGNAKKGNSSGLGDAELTFEEEKLEPKRAIDRSGNTIHLAGLSFLKSQPEYCLSFSQLFNEDLIVGAPPTAESIFLTTKTWKKEFLMPLIESGAKICLVFNSKTKKMYKYHEHSNFNVVQLKPVIKHRNEDREIVQNEDQAEEAKDRKEEAEDQIEETKNEKGDKKEYLPETQPETQPEAQPETQSETQPEAQPETQPEIQPEAQPETQPEIQPDHMIFHAKLFLIKFQEFLRVVVGSANLNKPQWEDITQVIWFQDFYPGNSTGPFCNQLTNFISEIFQGYLHTDPMNYLKKEYSIDLFSYDFSQASVELVASVPGIHEDRNKYGQGRIRYLLYENDLSFNSYTYQLSSIGKLSEENLEYFDRSFTNDTRIKREIVYPSQRYVKPIERKIESFGLYFPKNFYIVDGFPRKDLRDYDSPANFRRISNHICHSKVLISHNDHHLDQAAIYIGSHNFSSSAWGKFEDRGLKISNFELGILFINKSQEEFEEIVERLPFSFPPPRYSKNSEPYFT